MITIRKSPLGFPFLSSISMGLRLAELQNCKNNLIYRKKMQTIGKTMGITQTKGATQITRTTKTRAQYYTIYRDNTN